MTHRVFAPHIGVSDQPPLLDIATIDWRGGLLLRSTNWLGDAVMALPGAFRLRQLLPDGVPFAVSCKRQLSSFWACVPWVDQVFPFDGRRLSCPEALALVTRQHFGLSLVLPNSFGSAWDIWRSRIPIRVGRAGRGRRLLLTHCLPEYRRRAGQDEYHQARHYLELAAAFGTIQWDLHIPGLQPDVSAERARELIAHTGDVLVLAPGAAYGPAKQWPAANFRELAEWWLAEHGPVLVVGTEAETGVCAAVAEGLTGAENLAGKTSLQELVYVLGQARCAVVNDSGAMHLAAAAGTAGVALFGSTDPLATGPIGGDWIVICKRLPCAPCLQRSCPRHEKRYECLTDITVASVADELAQLLKD